MGISIRQTGRTTTSITIYTSTTIQHNKRTNIYIPQIGEWQTLTQAINNLWVQSVQNNGSYATINFYPNDALEYPCWIFYVEDVTSTGSLWDWSNDLYALVDLQWDNVKTQGQPCNVTYNEIKRYNRYMGQLGEMIGKRGYFSSASALGQYYDMSEVNYGDPISHSYIIDPLDNLFYSHAAALDDSVGDSEGWLYWRDTVRKALGAEIISTGKIKASHFHDIKRWLDNFYLRSPRNG